MFFIYIIFIFFCFILSYLCIKDLGKILNRIETLNLMKKEKNIYALNCILLRKEYIVKRLKRRIILFLFKFISIVSFVIYLKDFS